jgi:hypothetical protein
MNRFILAIVLIAFAIPAAAAQSLNDEGVLSNDGLFVQRVRQSILTQSINISSDGLATGINLKRHAQVQQVMDSPDGWKSLFAAAIATQATVINPATNTGAVALTPMNPLAAVSCTGAIAATTLTVTNAPVGSAIGIGQSLAGVGIAAGTYITALGTGTGGNGTYTVSVSQTVAAEAMTATPGNVDAMQALVTDTVINTAVAAVFNSFFGGQ